MKQTTMSARDMTYVCVQAYVRANYIQYARKWRVIDGKVTDAIKSAHESPITIKISLVDQIDHTAWEALCVTYKDNWGDNCVISTDYDTKCNKGTGTLVINGTL